MRRPLDRLVDLADRAFDLGVVEFLDRILPGMDGEVSKQSQRILARQGIEFRLSTKVTGAKPTKDERYLSGA